MQQPYALTLTEAARLVRLRQLSPIELVNASLERIDRLDGAIKAWAAIGSQTGGSTIRPASYCGIVGMKPTFGRISRYGMLPLAPSLDHVGIFTRSAADAAAMLQAMAGEDPRDPASRVVAAGNYIQA